MIQDYFKIEELVCPDVYKTFDQTAWQFFDSRLLITLETLRQRLNKRIIVNTWKSGGEFSQRGFRCIRCEIVQNKIFSNEIYVSPHMTGQGVDFDVEGLVAEEVRLWIVKNANIWPYPLRLEANVDWVHLDSRDAEKDKVYIFKS
jgi:hypothetical protein